MRKFVLTFTDCDGTSSAIAVSENLDKLHELMVKEAAQWFSVYYKEELESKDYSITGLRYIKNERDFILSTIYIENGLLPILSISDYSFEGLCNPSFSISACYEV